MFWMSQKMIITTFHARLAIIKDARKIQWFVQSHRTFACFIFAFVLITALTDSHAAVVVILFTLSVVLPREAATRQQFISVSLNIIDTGMQGHFLISRLIFSLRLLTCCQDSGRQSISSCNVKIVWMCDASAQDEVNSQHSSHLTGKNNCHWCDKSHGIA